MPDAKRRLSRAGVFAFASTVSAMTIVGCGSSDSTTTTPPADSGDSGVDSIVAAYGGPPDTSFFDSTTADTADAADTATIPDTAKDTGPEDGGGPVPAYGLPPLDSGT